MANRDWERFGEEIRRTVQNAVDSQDFERLNQTITNTINRAVDGAAQGMKNVGDVMGRAGRYGYHGDDRAGMTGRNKFRDEERKRGAYGQTEERFGYQPQVPMLYGKTTSSKVAAVIMAAVGYSLGACSFILFIIFMITGFTVNDFGLGFQILVVVFGILTAGFGITAGIGTSMLGRLKRFRAYLQTLAGKDYCNIKELAQNIRKSPQFVVKDVERMIAKGWFRQGHLDRQQTCLITSHQTYEQYVQMMEQAEQSRQEEERLKKQREADRAKTQQEYADMPEEVQRIIREGDAYIQKIHQCNDAIPGEEISAKISRMETLVDRIFDRVEQNPETVSDIRRLMEYYLPTTVKLLEAYEDLDAQPVQGENILSSKKEIEGTLDTLNMAFEKLLDDLFQDTAWDVASDISVLHTMLAQEGLTGNDFEK